MGALATWWGPLNSGGAPAGAYDTITWTTFSQAAGDRIIYVSDSIGNDAWDGYGSTAPLVGTVGPKKTIAAGLALLRDGFADWCLLKKGDTFTNQTFGTWSKSGRSSAQKMLIGSYGTGVRPKIDTNLSGLVSGGGAAISHVAFTGFEAYPGSYNGSNADPEGMRFVGQQSDDILIENVYVHSYSFNVDVQGVNIGNVYPLFNSITNVTIRGSTLYGAYRNTGTTVEGIYAFNVNGLTVEFCSLDTNGYIVPTQQTVLRRNAYIDNVNANVVFKNNWFFYTDGIQLRCGGQLTNNVFSRETISMSLGGGSAPIDPAGVSVQCEDNVVLEGTAPSAGAGGDCWAVYIDNLTGGTIKRNIIASSQSTGAPTVFRMEIHNGTDPIVCQNVDISNNVAYNWGGYSLYLRHGQSFYGGNTFANNVFQNPTNAHFYGPENGSIIFVQNQQSSAQFSHSSNTYCLAPGATWYVEGYVSDHTLTTFLADIGDSGSNNTPVAYADPTRTVATYYASIGGSADHDAFTAAVRAMDKDTWDNAKTAPAMVVYMKAGFV